MIYSLISNWLVNGAVLLSELSKNALKSHWEVLRTSWASLRSNMQSLVISEWSLVLSTDRTPAELCYETSLSAAASPEPSLNMSDFIVFGSDGTDGTDSSESSAEWPTGLLSHRTPLTLSPPSSSSSGHHFCPQIQRTVKPWWQLTTRGSELCPCSGERHDKEDGSTVDRRTDAAGTELNNTETGNCERRSTAPAAANQSIGLTSASCVLSSEKSNRCLIDSVACPLCPLWVFDNLIYTQHFIIPIISLK